MDEDYKRIFKQKKLNTRLLNSVYNKNIENVVKQPANGAHPNTQCQNNRVSCAHLAAFHGTVNILEKLIDKEIDLKMRDFRGLQPHHVAGFQNESLPCLKLILDKQKDLIDSPIVLEQTEVVLRDEVSDSYRHKHDVLTDLNALKVTDDEGYTPLFRAIRSGYADCVQALLETSAGDDYKITIKDSEFTILHAAIKSVRKPDVILQRILEYLMKEESKNIVLLNQTNSEGCTAIDLAAKMGEAKCLDLLLKYDNINVKPTDSDKKTKKNTALHHAAKKGYYVCLEKLLDKCEDLIDMIDINGLTALIHAARGGHSKSVEILLKRGANLAAKDTSVNRTAVDINMFNVPRAVEIMDNVLNSFILLSKNSLPVKVTKETITENNQNDETVTNQEYIPFLNNIGNDKQNENHEDNSSNQVNIDMIPSEPSSVNKNKLFNYFALRKKGQQSKVNKKTTNIEEISSMDISNN